MWIVLTLLIVASAVLWVAGVRPTRAWSKAGPSLATLAVDRGDLDVVVVEYGALQSTDNATVRCRVEALIGQVGGISGGTGRGGAGGTQGGAAGAAGGSLTTPGATAKAQASGAAAGKAATGKAATGKAATGSASSGAGAAIDAGAAGGGAAMGAAGGGGNQRPVIRSFTMQVVPHVPLRPRTTTAPQTKVAQLSPGDPSGRGGGGGRQGGG
ncbi:MAG TPA: HlyD family secretion protein, partial [Isosphaeraceae bacterium]